MAPILPCTGHMARYVVALLALFVGAGCGDQTGIPQPDPIPIASAIRTTGVMPGAKEEIDVVGLPGAVAGAGQVTVTGQLETITASSTPAGSFVLTIKAQLDEQLQIRYRSSEAVQVQVYMMPITSAPQPDPFHTGEPITKPVNGETTITGLATAGAQIVAVNYNTGDTGSATADAAAKFEVKVKASTGDEIRTYSLGEPMTEPWIQIVP
jgi:hypothetical protein